MKNKHISEMRVLSIAIFAVFYLNAFTQRPTAGGFNVYFGHLHNHTSYSDGQGTPAQAYTTAKANGLDFLGLSDHSHLLSDTEWTSTLTEADNFNEENVFTTFRGFEWTSSSYGHVTVVNTPAFIATNNASYDTFSELCTWLKTQDCIAFFNHPGDYNSAGTEFNHFDINNLTDKIVGMEFWNKTSGFSKYYYNSYNGTVVPGFYTGDGMAFYDEALQRGWKIGAQGSEDNHVASWGALTNYKTAVLAVANTRTELLNAYKARRFYSTRYNTIALSFKIDGNEMGSTITPGLKSIQIQVTENNTLRTVRKVELLKNGVVINSWNPSVNNVIISETVDCTNGDYFYIRTHEYLAANTQNDYCQITAVSSPIWIEGQSIPNVAPVAVDDSGTTDEDVPLVLNLINNDYDPDGTIDAASVDIDTETAGRQTLFNINSEGTFTVDNAGKLTFTPVKDFNGNVSTLFYTVSDNQGAVSNVAAVNIYVNPVDDVQTIFITINASRQIVVTCTEPIVKGAKINVYNAATGKLVATSVMKTEVTTIKTKLSAGVYTVTVINGSNVVTENVIVK